MTTRRGRFHILREEPFRLFFPLGAAFGFWGVSHWVWYYAGITETYSCTYHGLIQIQAFEGAFLTGFLMTALPRFLEADSPRAWEIAISLALVCLCAAALFENALPLAQTAFSFQMLHLAIFSGRRFAVRGDDPPATFAFVPFGILHGFLGATFIRFPLDGFVRLGHLMVEQGMLVCLILAFGNYLGPRLLQGKSSDESASGSGAMALLSVVTGSLILSSFFLEAGYALMPGRLLRAVAVTAFAFVSLPLRTRPKVRLFHVSMIWHAFWFVIAGLWLSALFPDYDIVFLHVMFIGGFSMLTLLVASRVVSAHCGFEEIWQRNARSLVGLGVFFLAALLCRLLSDVMVWYYFGMLHIAAGMWMTGLIIWAIVFLPRMTPGHTDAD